jgi:hypothetical protein
MERNNPGIYLDPMGTAVDSVTQSVNRAIATGDPNKIRALLQTLKQSGYEIDAVLEKAALEAAKRLESTVAQIVARECQGKVLREIPSEYLKKTLADIIRLRKTARGAEKDALDKVWKLLTDNRFKK